MKDKDTPETDNILKGSPSAWNVNVVELVELARKLERERDEARREAERWRDNWKEGKSMSMISSSKTPWERLANKGGCTKEIEISQSAIIEKLKAELDCVWERIEEVKRVRQSGYTDREMEEAIRNL